MIYDNTKSLWFIFSDRKKDWLFLNTGQSQDLH